MKKNFLKTICIAMLIVVVGVAMSGCKSKYDFADDKVLFVLTYDATQSTLTSGEPYNLENFPEIDAIAVDHLTALTWERIRQERNGERTPDPNWIVDKPEYRCIYMITLSQKKHKNVLDVVKVLEQRSDIQSAGPSYSGSIA